MKQHDAATAFISDFNGRLLTTEWILMEVGDALSGIHNRPKFVEFVGAIRDHQKIEILTAGSDLFQLALGLYSKRSDKDWPLTDCTSFVVMQQHGITEAITADRHFEQAGFTALLAT